MQSNPAPPLAIEIFSNSAYTPKLQNDGRTTRIYDAFRKQYVVLQPEEWVRQHLLNYLVTQRDYPAVWIAVEHLTPVQGMPQRADAVIYKKDGTPFLLIECKAEQIPITRSVVEQMARYNHTLRAEYMAATNGHEHLIFRGLQQIGDYPPYPR